VNLNDIEKEIEELEHTVFNIWNIKKQDSKKALHMFNVELKPKNKEIYNVSLLLQYRIKFEFYHIQNVRFLNVLIASGTVTQKVFTFKASKRDASNAQTTQSLTVRVRRNLRTSNNIVSYSMKVIT